MAAVIDLRSDTLTRPDREMREAMAAAEVGDDVYGEDPTVRRLEELAAARVGCEAALFVPSGTMGNQIALKLHAQPGQEVVCDEASHVLLFEMGAMAAISGLVPRPLPSADGRLSPAAVAAAMLPPQPLRSSTGAIVVENSHNAAGGTVSRQSLLAELVALARRQRLPIHLDGARIFNAAVALGVEVEELTAGFDSVMFCLSKGLGAPVGSLLCGRQPWIDEARRVRKMLGGGMRQVGVLAAAGLVALARGPERLQQDHDNAARLARGLAELPAFELDPAAVETNIVITGLRGSADGAEPRAPGVARRLADSGVRASPWLRDQLRFVTHRDVDRAQVEEAIARIRRALE